MFEKHTVAPYARFQVVLDGSDETMALRNASSLTKLENEGMGETLSQSDLQEPYSLTDSLRRLPDSDSFEVWAACFDCSDSYFCCRADHGIRF